MLLAVAQQRRSLNLRPTPTVNQLTTSYAIELENTAKPACVAETLPLLLP